MLPSELKVTSLVLMLPGEISHSKKEVRPAPVHERMRTVLGNGLICRLVNICEATMEPALFEGVTSWAGTTAAIAVSEMGWALCGSLMSKKRVTWVTVEPCILGILGRAQEYLVKSEGDGATEHSGLLLPTVPSTYCCGEVLVRGRRMSTTTSSRSLLPMFLATTLKRVISVVSLGASWLIARSRSGARGPPPPPPGPAWDARSTRPAANILADPEE
mmetsp:Transcript_27854/g.93123  ORF Transcript_27854/g.93123 Transcript_27854/m.93123 type:complete len:217 (-) Transcript_27854:1380-2030(-)